MLKNRLFYELGLIVKLKNKDERVKSISIINDNPLTIPLKLLIKEHIYNFDIIFPRYFPFQPITVQSKTDFHTSHMYADNSMCLKWGIDNWVEDITAKEMIENLIELLEVENPLGKEHKKAVSGDEFSLFQQVNRSKKGTLFLSEYIHKQFKNPKGVGQLVYKTLERNNRPYVWNYVYFIKSIGRKRYYSITKEDEEFKTVKFDYYKIDMDFDEYIKLENKPQIKLTKPAYIIVFKDKIIFEIKFQPSKKELEYMIPDYRRDNPESTNGKSDEEIANHLRIKLAPSVKFIEDENKGRIRISEEVLNKKITIFGLGSVGSRVLLDLARAGFMNFVIVDDDLFLPSNIVRHELDVTSIGESKVHALAKTLVNKINFKINVVPIAFALNGQNSSSSVERLFKSIEDSEIIIDCTADSNLIFSLNEFVKEKDLNYVSGAVISGGIGNILVKREKESNLSIIDILETQKKFMNINNLNQEPNEEYTGRYGNREYIATMSDVSLISGIIGKTAINMLRNDGELLENDIYFMSTSNDLLGGFYNCQPINAHKRNYESMSLDEKIIKIGERYYENNFIKKN